MQPQYWALSAQGKRRGTSPPPQEELYDISVPEIAVPERESERNITDGRRCTRTAVLLERPQLHVLPLK
jgi:hypothetical protein